ncbi:hypothetical protein GN956_G7080 [Arapaima gigas]
MDLNHGYWPTTHTNFQFGTTATKKEDSDVDADQSFLDQVLNKLYDFGDGSRAEKKKCKKRKKQKVDVAPAEDLAGDGLWDIEKKDVENSNSSSGSHLHTGGSRTTDATQVEIVTFHEPFKKKNKTESKDPEIKLPQENKKKDPTDFSLEKARLEVHRFGISGFQKQQQRQFEQERAVMLGAQPPKKEYINYKAYQQMIKEKKQKEKEEIKLDTKKKKKQETKGKVEKRKPSSSLPAGRVGRFKDGMLVLSSREIQNIKRSRVIK